jgi:hypothetical protein
MVNKQTAVEWLVRILYSPMCVGFIQGRRQIPYDIIQRAKQMEKEQTGDWVETHWYEEIDGKKYKLYYNKNNEWK